MLLIALLAACGNPPEIEVHVVDIWNKPVAGATVVVSGQTERIQVDASGTAEIQAEPGVVELTAGADGYVKDVARVEVKPDQEGPAKVTVTLFPEPPGVGFWAVGDKGYVALDALEVKAVTTGNKVIYGVQDAPEATVPGGDQPLRVVYHAQLRKDQIAQQDIRLSKLAFKEKTEVVSPLGPVEVKLNLWLSERDIPYSVKEMASHNQYLLVTGSPLEPGMYAFHARNILNESDEGAIERTPEELRKVYGFQVR